MENHLGVNKFLVHDHPRCSLDISITHNVPLFLQPDDKYQELLIACDAWDRQPGRTYHTCQ